MRPHTLLERIAAKYGMRVAQELSGNANICEVFRYTKPEVAHAQPPVLSILLPTTVVVAAAKRAQSTLYINVVSSLASEQAYLVGIRILVEADIVASHVARYADPWVRFEPTRDVDAFLPRTGDWYLFTVNRSSKAALKTSRCTNIANPVTVCEHDWL